MYENSEVLEGTVSRDVLNFVFLLLLVPFDTPRKVSEIFRIFEELFVFVINLPDVITTVDSWLPGVFITQESRLPRDEYTGESTLVYKNLLVRNTPGSEGGLGLVHGGGVSSWSICHQKFFFGKPVLMLVPNTPRSWLPVYSLLGSRDSLVYSSPRSCFRCQVVILSILRSINYQVTIILKSDCRLL